MESSVTEQTVDEATAAVSENNDEEKLEQMLSKSTSQIRSKSASLGFQSEASEMITAAAASKKSASHSVSASLTKIVPSTDIATPIPTSVDEKKDDVEVKAPTQSKEASASVSSAAISQKSRSPSQIQSNPKFGNVTTEVVKAPISKLEQYEAKAKSPELKNKLRHWIAENTSIAEHELKLKEELVADLSARLNDARKQHAKEKSQLRYYLEKMPLLDKQLHEYKRLVERQDREIDDLKEQVDLLTRQNNAKDTAIAKLVQITKQQNQEILNDFAQKLCL